MSPSQAGATVGENESDLYSVENLLARARMLAPKLRERSHATNKTGRIPDETIADFWEYHLNYLLRPKKTSQASVKQPALIEALFRDLQTNLD
jgi:hypothetical protein